MMMMMMMEMISFSSICHLHHINLSYQCIMYLSFTCMSSYLYIMSIYYNFLSIFHLSYLSCLSIFLPIYHIILTSHPSITSIYSFLSHEQVSEYYKTLDFDVMLFLKKSFLLNPILMDKQANSQATFIIEQLKEYEQIQRVGDKIYDDDDDDDDYDQCEDDIYVIHDADQFGD